MKLNTTESLFRDVSNENVGTVKLQSQTNLKNPPEKKFFPVDHHPELTFLETLNRINGKGAALAPTHSPTPPHLTVSYPLRSLKSDSDGHSLGPHGLSPARLLHPWDSPDKNTGVGCHFLL